MENTPNTPQQTYQTSAIGKLDINDFAKGLAVAVISAVLTIVMQSLQAGSFNFDWKNIGIVAATSAGAYLLKNFGTQTQTIVKTLVLLVMLSFLSSCASIGALIKADCSVQYNVPNSLDSTSTICLHCKNKLALEAFDSIKLKAIKK
jgi:hypothetical protein